MALMSPALIGFYVVIAIGGIIYLIILIAKRTGKIIKGEKTPKSWLQEELDTFKKKDK